MTDLSQQIAQTLTLTSPSSKSLRPLIESAIHNELRLMQAGIRRTQQRIANFEAQYGMTTAEFLQRYRSDAISETLETIEWVGEWRMLERLREDEAALREVGFAD
jgi:phage shock protein A